MCVYILYNMYVLHMYSLSRLHFYIRSRADEPIVVLLPTTQDFCGLAEILRLYVQFAGKSVPGGMDGCFSIST